ncbi:MAG: DUF4340 domain-containing protein [Planctomycetes bacterium]|nr:DUF4340 domain-containing protein [Planctomycetota bacterium]
MNDSMKTLAYLGTAAFFALIAFVSYPSTSVQTATTLIGKGLFENFTDPLLARSIEIVSYDEAQGEIDSFKVMQNSKGNWVIPSKSDYQADAQNQLKDAANSLLNTNLIVLDIASSSPEDHPLYGVIAPDAEKVKAGDKNVGRLVKIADASGKSLASLVIGKAERGNPKRRFVRVPSQDPVYVVELDLDKIKTKFEDWIDKNLLKLDSAQLERVVIKDYSVVPTNVGKVLDPRMEADLKFDNTGNKWSVHEIVTFRKARQQGEAQRVPSVLAETEELNDTKLNDLKSALNSLQIVDVMRKPKGLSADLKAEQSLTENQETLLSLEAAGFHMTANGEIRSANGEINVGLKDGIDYVLRFGGITGRQDDSKDLKLNRFLFVMATLDESRIPAPELELEPQEPPLSPASGDGAAEGAAGEAEGNAKPACQDSPPQPSGSQDSNQEPKSAADVERERIKKSNERKMSEWRDRKKKAADKVADLNDRFADWYYVISEDSYKKVHLGRADIVREATKAKDEGFGIDAFRKLEKDGLKKDGPSPSSSPLLPPR